MLILINKFNQVKKLLIQTTSTEHFENEKKKKI